MPHNAYAPPGADLLVEEGECPAKREALKHIRNAWIAALVCTLATLVLTVLSGLGVELGIPSINKWSILDVVLKAALTLGIYKRSRLSAVLMFTSMLLTQILLFTATGRYSGGIIAPILLYVLARGVQGTYVWHQNAPEGVNPSASANPHDIKR
jgi:hypothetical protein